MRNRKLGNIEILYLYFISSKKFYGLIIDDDICPNKNDEETYKQRFKKDMRAQEIIISRLNEKIMIYVYNKL